MKKIKLIQRYTFDPILQRYKDNLTGKTAALEYVQKYGGSRWKGDKELVFKIEEA